MSLVYTLIAFLVIVGFVFYFFRKRSDDIDIDESDYNMDNAIKNVKVALRDRLIIDTARNGVASDKEQRTIKEIRASLDKAPHGSPSDKAHSKAITKEIFLDLYEIDEQNISKFIPFDNLSQLNVIDKFHIMMYYHRYILNEDTEAFNKWVDRHNLYRVRSVKYSAIERTLSEQEALIFQKKGFPVEIVDGKPVLRTDRGFIIYDTDVEKAFDIEYAEMELTLLDKINIVTQEIYGTLFGLGAIDELIDMNIDGIRGGTGGIPESALNLLGGFREFDRHTPKRDFESIRLFFRGNQMHLDFLKFKSGRDLRRVVNTIYQFGRVGQLNRESGYKYSERADHSRVVVMIPDLSDSPAFFVRKFDPRLRDLREWFDPRHGNWEMIYDWIKFCAAAGITICFTGAQGSGKTTIMRGAMKFFPFNWNIRIIEGTFFELWIRLNFWWKDVITLRETPTVSQIKSSEIVRRTDGTMTIFGEVISDEGVREATKASRIGSFGTWFSYHTMTLLTMVHEAATSLVITKASTDKKEAVREIARSINANLHLQNDMGNRYMARFTQLEEAPEIPYDVVLDNSMEESVASIARNLNQWANKTTEAEGFTYSDLFVFNIEEQSYEVVGKPSKTILDKFSRYMDGPTKEEFKEYASRVFGFEWEG